ncbi:MAG: GNAT family N-acetyltransferase [Armatimonadetes bacterium]|nr:GNAT family N-acetyltransferase [Armatimonadota bacterium]
MTELYGKVGFVSPWTGYLAFRDASAVGVGGFKSPPKSGVVEIAYHTFVVFEGQGIATGIAAQLVQIAHTADPSVRVQACTLPEESASTTVLLRNGFAYMGTVSDPEDAETPWKRRAQVARIVQNGFQKRNVGRDAFDEKLVQASAHSCYRFGAGFR